MAEEPPEYICEICDKEIEYEEAYRFGGLCEECWFAWLAEEEREDRT
jgi:transcription initiation factor IIE alpha subunit